MRARVLPLLVVLLAGGALALSSCGEEEKDAGAYVAKAAAATRDKGAARMTMRMRMSGLGMPRPLTVSASGVTALGEPRGRMTIDFEKALRAVGAPAAAGGVVELVMDGADLYVKPPRIDGLRVPGGKSWVSLDLRSLAEAAGLPTEGMGSLFNLEPAAQLRAMKAAKGLEEVGKEEVDGIETTHFRGTYRLSDMIAGLPAAEREDARKALAALERVGGQETGMNDPIPADLWIDDDGLMRRMRSTSKLPAQQGVPPGSMSMEYALRDFGAKLDVTAPPDADTFDATEVLSGFVEDAAAATR